MKKAWRSGLYGLWGMLLVAVSTQASCEADRTQCDPNDRSACGAAAQCVRTAEGAAYCEPLMACSPSDPASCPGGYVCRPNTAGGALCEPQITAGRIPSCLDGAGMDVFAVEASSALSVTWNVNGALDSQGGFEVAYGTAAGTYSASVRVSTNIREAVVSPLQNGTPYFVVVRALGSSGSPSFTSCQITATPHVLKFQPDRVINTNTSGNQQTPDIVSNLEGNQLFLGWEDAGKLTLARSSNFGDTWTESTFPSGASQAVPTLALREAVTAMGSTVRPAVLMTAWTEGSSVKVARYRVTEGMFDPPITVGTGAEPDIAVTGDRVHLAYANAGKVVYLRSDDDGTTFSSPLEVQGTTTNAQTPALAVDILSNAVYVGWHAQQGGGDSNVYLSASADKGGSFTVPVRIDDDKQGLNQRNLSLAVDPRDHEVYATWEDRRGGANVYFSLSADAGKTWMKNLDVGAGLGGDQFNPAAVIDVAGNVYVAFQDTTQGARVVFTRFNAMQSFDPPLVPSSKAGMAGVVADRPSVATDRYGTVYLTWQENRNGPSNEVIFSRAQ